MYLHVHISTDCGLKYSHDDGGHFVYQRHLPVIECISETIWIAQINRNVHRPMQFFT